MSNANTFCASFSGEMNEEQKAAMQEIMDAQADGYRDSVKGLSKELNISEACASDVWYLRTRNRWSQELENQLIELHQAGNPPNIMDFGVTEQTQKALMDSVRQE